MPCSLHYKGLCSTSKSAYLKYLTISFIYIFVMRATHKFRLFPTFRDQFDPPLISSLFFLAEVCQVSSTNPYCLCQLSALLPGQSHHINLSVQFLEDVVLSLNQGKCRLFKAWKFILNYRNKKHMILYIGKGRSCRKC